jgi:hypothetical protein
VHSNQIQDKGPGHPPTGLAECLTEKKVGEGGVSPMCHFPVGTLRFFPANLTQSTVFCRTALS